MNWLSILVLLVLALSIMEGYRRGFLRMVYSLLSWVIIFIFMSYVTPYVQQLLVDHTAVYERVQENFEETVRQAAQEKLGTGAEAGETEWPELGMQLPAAVMDRILAQTTGANGFLEESGVYAQVAAGLADFVVQGIAYLITMLLAWTLVHVASDLLGIVSRIPLLKGMNRLAGLAAGAVYGFLIVWLAFYVIALCGSSPAGQVLVSCIYDSPFLTLLYENNLVLTLAVSLLYG